MCSVRKSSCGLIKKPWSISQKWELMRRLTRNIAGGSGLMSRKDVFEKIKDTVSKAPVLKYFSESDLTENPGEASKDALAFVLMLHGQPVTCRSGPIRLAEGKYLQIGSEFWSWSLARSVATICSPVKVILWADRKPQMLFKQKPKRSAPKRLEHPFVATSAVWPRDTLQA